MGYSACESAAASQCLTGEIAVVTPHRDTIILLGDQGHLSCQSPYTHVMFRDFHLTSGSGMCSVWELRADSDVFGQVTFTLL
jgi:hypothetical protein